MSPRSLRLAYVSSLLLLVAALVWLSEGGWAAIKDARGPNRLEIPLQVERPAMAEVFYDRGEGTRQEDSAAVPVAPASGATMRVAAFPIPRVAVRGLRFDPIAFEGKFAVGEPRWTTASGRVLVRLPLSAVHPQNQIAELRLAGDRLEGATTAGANDAQLAIELPMPLPAGGVAVPWMRGLVVAGLAMAAGRLRGASGSRGWVAGKLRGSVAEITAMNARTLVLGALVVGGVELWLLWPLQRTLDWPLWDEANYAAFGAAWARGSGTLGELHSAPLFMASYGVWSHLGGLAAAIFAQHYFVKLGSTLLLFFVLTRWWRSWLAAAGVALVWGATQFQLEFPLLVYQAAWLWFLAALAVVDRWPLAGLGFVAMAMGVRQEYQFAVALLAGWLGWRAWRMRSWRWLVTTDAGGGLVVGALLAVLSGSVVGGVLTQTSFGHSEGRAWFAFQQHYAVRAVETGEVKGINPWTDYPQVVERDFGGARSLGDAWKKNSAAVVRHVGYNLRMAPWEVARLGDVHAGLGAAAGLLVLGALLALAANDRKRPGEDARALRPSVVLGAASFIVVAPGLFVLAKGAYLLPVVPAVIGGAGWLVAGLARRGGWWLSLGGAMALAAGVVVVAEAPRIFVPGERSRPVAGTLAELEKNWPKTGRAALLGAGASSYAHYLGDERCLGVEPFSETSGVAGQSARLGDLLARFQPLAVLVTDDWRRSSRFDAGEIARALPSPEWIKREVPAGELYWRGR